MDTFVEVLVKKKNRGIDRLKKLGLVVLTVIVCLALLLFLPIVPGLGGLTPLLVVGTVFGSYFLITSLNIEYEYIFTNGELDVDKIVAQRKRSRVITFSCKAVERMGRYNPVEHPPTNYTTRIQACADVTSDDTWFLVLSHSKFGKTLLLISHNEKLFSNMRPYLPRTVELPKQEA